MNADSKRISNAQDLPEERLSEIQELGEELIKNTLGQFDSSQPPATLNPRTPGSGNSVGLAMLATLKSKAAAIIKDAVTELENVRLELNGSNDENQKLRVENENMRVENGNMLLTIEGLQELIAARDTMIHELTIRIDNASQAMSAGDAARTTAKYANS